LLVKKRLKKERKGKEREGISNKSMKTRKTPMSGHLRETWEPDDSRFSGRFPKI
jgi:hypothetical protein